VLQDLDDCLLATTDQMLKYGRTVFDIGQGFELWRDSNEYEIEANLPEFNETKLQAMFQDPAFWQAIEPCPGALEFNHWLHSFYEVHIVTDRRWYPQLKRETESYLNALGFRYDSLVICKGREKGRWARSNGIDFAIEDKWTNALLLEPVCHTALIHQPWNRKEVIEPGQCLYRIQHEERRPIDYETLLRLVIRADIAREQQRQHYLDTGDTPARTPLNPVLQRRRSYAQAA
jgi:5'(3')-deoxyribonucleotidase